MTNGSFEDASTPLLNQREGPVWAASDIEFRPATTSRSRLYFLDLSTKIKWPVEKFSKVFLAGSGTL